MAGTFCFMYVDTGVPVGEVLEGFIWPRLPSKHLPTVRTGLTGVGHAVVIVACPLLYHSAFI